MAPTLFFEEGSYKGTAVKFKNFLVIGSGESANLKLEEQGIAPLHVAFIKGNDSFYVLNLDENNNIYLNSEPIQNARINNEDLVAITENCIIKFSIEEGEDNGFAVAHTQNNNKKKFSNIPRKNITGQINEAQEIKGKSSFIKKTLVIIAWILLAISILTVSFVTGIYTTDLILQIK